MEPLRIGIILNYKKAEKKKDELLNVNSNKLSWMKHAIRSKHSRSGILHSDLLIKKGKSSFAPDDVAIGIYIESMYPNVIIDYITPDEISTRRFKKNDIVLVIIYDLLEAFHLSDPTKFKKYKNALKNSPNVYPPYEYQKFINNKCKYYRYLADKDVPVAPTYCVSREKLFKRNPTEYVNRLISKINNNKWESIIAKPVYGQESIDFAKFMKCGTTQPGVGLGCNKKRMVNYFSRTIPKYKEVVIQEYINGFDKNNPEYRTFFINGEYMYTIVTTDKKVSAPVQEGGKFKVPEDIYRYVIRFAQGVMDILPKLDLPGEYRSPIVTRIDIGSGLEDVPHNLFINEIEFVPSLYVDELNPDRYPVIPKIAESLVDIALEYKRYPKLPIKVEI